MKAGLLVVSVQTRTGWQGGDLTRPSHEPTSHTRSRLGGERPDEGISGNYWAHWLFVGILDVVNPAPMFQLFAGQGVE